MRVEGLEPPRLAAPDPKSGAAANYATPACDLKKEQSESGDPNTPYPLVPVKKGAQIYRLFADPITLFNKIEFSFKMRLIR